MTCDGMADGYDVKDEWEAETTDWEWNCMSLVACRVLAGIRDSTFLTQMMHM